ncbi:NmrA-domain-containing protein [Mycena amicta]|nr:NmrA-domain-containing protein [Mycena amicta]
MTITQDTNSPLVVVAGATGNQGGSVVRALIESEKAYRIRGLTRNALKPATKALKEKGVEIVAVSVTAENKDAVFKAFEGAHVAFLVTNWVDHGEPTRQIAEAKLMIDAAKAGGAKGIIWSGLPSPAALSAGKYTQVVPFESKVLVAEYGRQSGVPFVDVQGGGYASDFLTTKRPRRIAPYADVWQVSFPMAPSLEVPLLDAERDYGLFVRKVIEAEVFPDKATWAAWGETQRRRSLQTTQMTERRRD